MFAELLGKEAGYCKGKGGSMHIADPDTGNLGANAIVGGSMGIATGAALSAKRLKTDRVAVCFFGDGAHAVSGTFEGIFIGPFGKCVAGFRAAPDHDAARLAAAHRRTKTSQMLAERRGDTAAAERLSQQALSLAEHCGAGYATADRGAVARGKQRLDCRFAIGVDRQAAAASWASSYSFGAAALRSRGAVLAEADRVVGQHEDAASLDDRRHPERSSRGTPRLVRGSS